MILIIRWVITTILFSEKKRQYITTILSLSSETQFYLQCIIETVMNAFPQDNTTSSALSEMHTILEESSISLQNDEASFSVLENSRMELRHRFEGVYGAMKLHTEEIQQLESKLVELQQQLSCEKEESESLRRQRDELQKEVGKLESELREQQQIVKGLEGNERRLSLEAEDLSYKSSEEIRSLKESNEQLSVEEKETG